jgi:large subunit ribosomal protein L15
MQAHDLKPPKGAKHARKRIGRGNASGHGTYSSRGLKGQKSRAGRKPRRFFEGGQTELMRRLPRKRGFTNRFRVEFTPVNLRDLVRFDDGAEITPETLKEAGLVATLRIPVKVLGTGDIDRKLNVTAHKFSKSAREKIEAAGGTATALIPDVPKPEKRLKKKSKAKSAPVAEAESPAAEATKEEAAVEAEDEGDGDSE